MKVYKKSNLFFIIFSCIVFFFFILIFIVKDHNVLYTDFGLMYLQLKHLIAQNFKTFALDYPAYALDKNYEFFPYTKPFIGKIDNRLYIDFPPYFPLLNAPFFMIFGNKGLYVLNFICLILTFFIILKFSFLVLEKRESYIFSIFLYAFGTTATLYNFTFHEYPIALLLSTLSFYFYFYSTKNLSYKHGSFSGFFAGLSLFFRLELIFFYISFNLVYLILKRKESFKTIISFSFAFLIPFILLLYLNQLIHLHPLGLRYYLTITDNETLSVLERLKVIYEILFDNKRGFFYQSPYLILLFTVAFFKRSLFKNETFKFLYFSFFCSFILICIFIPNHGDHISPRYLFSILFIGIITLLIFLESIHFKVLKFIFIFFMISSFHSTYKSYEFVLKSDKEISNLLNMIKKNSSDILIFDYYAYPLNLQMIYEEKKFLVYKDLNHLEKLLKILEKNKINKFSLIVQKENTLPEDLKNINFKLKDIVSYKQTNLRKYERIE